MRDVIQRVIAAEGEAKRLVQVGTMEAERILSEAEKTGQRHLAQARQEAQAEAARLIEEAIQTGESEKQECLTCLAAKIETDVGLEETRRQKAIVAAVRCVCGQL